MNTFDRFQILSLDGGGIKGLFSAAVLAKVEEDLHLSVADHFDLIVGTSTGGIIALALGLGYPARKIVEFYEEWGPKIFKKTPFLTELYKYWRCRYSQEPLRTALQTCFGQQLLGDSKKRLIIPSYNLDKDEVYLFKTRHDERFNRDWKEPVWKVALATSAAPTYFPLCEHVDQIRLVDGGLWANNPTMIGVVEAIGILRIDPARISVLSLGTTNAVLDRPKSLNRGGMFQWRSVGIDAAMRGQSNGVNGQVKHLLSADRLVRIDPQVPDSLFALDKPSASRLLSEASHVSRHLMPVFQEKFQPHVAPKFSPVARAQGVA